MESEVFARTNGYCIFCGIESSTGLVKQLINLMGYRKRRKAIFYNGSSYKETLEDTRPYEVISCYFPINEPVLSNTLVHGKIFNEKENIIKINRIHDILTKNCLDTNFCLDID